MSALEQTEIPTQLRKDSPKPLDPEPRLRYTLHLLDLRKNLKQPDGSSVSWLDLPKNVQPYQNATEMTDNIRQVVEQFVTPNINELFFGDKARVPSFKQFSPEAMVDALAKNEPEDITDDISGQRREVLASVAAGIVNRIENYVTRQTLEAATPETLEKLGLTADSRDLTVELLKITSRVNPLFTRFLAWGQISSEPPKDATVTEFFLENDQEAHTQAELFPKESKYLAQAFKQVAQKEAGWKSLPGADKFEKYIGSLGTYYGETNSGKMLELREKCYEQYRQLMKSDFPVFVVPPTEGYYKEPYDDPDARVCIAAPEAKAEEPDFYRAQHAYAASLDQIKMEQFSGDVDQAVSRSTIVLGMFGVSNMFNAAAQNTPAIMMYKNQQERTIDRAIPAAWKEIFGEVDLPPEKIEFMSRMIVMLHEYSHFIFSDKTDEAKRLGRQPLTAIDEVKADALYRALIPAIIDKGGLDGTKEQWADGMFAASLKLLEGENAGSVYFAGAVYSLNDLFAKNVVSLKNGLFKINNYDAYYQVYQDNAQEILDLYQDPTMNSTKANRFNKSNFSPNQKLAQAIEFMKHSSEQLEKKEKPYTIAIPELYQPSPENWQVVAEGINTLEQAVFGDSEGGPFDEETLEEIFNLEGNVAILLRDESGEIIGYTVAVPLSYENPNEENPEEGGYRLDVPREDDGEKTAYIESIAVLPKWQHHGLAGLLNTSCDDQLVKSGYEFVELDADENNGYDKIIERVYKDKIIADKPHIQRGYGMKHWLRIKLPTAEDVSLES